ncbi:MAG: hypothetical protein BGO01_17515 [Armatimonadetes bacterium 55-13]|nr:MAG: hypothetical protein BGO01_17515 [Armatimonadetes bacterium 55-13]
MIRHFRLASEKMESRVLDDRALKAIVLRTNDDLYSRFREARRMGRVSRSLVEELIQVLDDEFVEFASVKDDRVDEYGRLVEDLIGALAHLLATAESFAKG